MNYGKFLRFAFIFGSPLGEVLDKKIGCPFGQKSLPVMGMPIPNTVIGVRVDN